MAALLAELLRQKAGLLREYFSIDVDAGGLGWADCWGSFGRSQFCSQTNGWICGQVKVQLPAAVFAHVLHAATIEMRLVVPRCLLLHAPAPFPLHADGCLSSLPQLIEQYMPDLGESRRMRLESLR